MYKNLLIAIDLEEAAAIQAIETARAVADDDASLHVLHIVEPQYVQYGFDPTFSGTVTRSLEQEALAASTKWVAKLCESLALPADAQTVEFGHPASEIRRQAESRTCDAIVIASHGRHGWQLLLGSTANAVLHGTPTDVVVCRVPDPS